jgi:hypothetical protein
MLAAVCLILIFAILNRARGSHLFGMLDSTNEGRAIATFLMAAATAIASQGDYLDMAEILLWTWAGLIFWCVFGWDEYWGAAIGSTFNPNKPEFSPVDWLMLQMPWFTPVYNATATDLRRRLWGAVAMGLRQGLAVPCLVGMAYMTGHPNHGWYAAGTLLFGFIYMASGYLVALAYAIPLAEPVVGAALGFLAKATIN